MKAKVTRTPYPRFTPNGTIGEVIGAGDNGVVLRVDGTFPDTNPSEELGKTDFFFELNQVQFLPEPAQNTAVEDGFVNYCNIIAARLALKEWVDVPGASHHEQFLAGAVARAFVYARKHGLKLPETIVRFLP